MLDFLSKSKIRRRIILLFVHNPDKEYYLSEIARLVGTSAGTAQRELNRLLRADLISFRKKSGIGLYYLNQSFSLLDEVESIINKTFGAEAAISDELKNVPGVAFAFLFGSYVKGGFKSGSDIDLFIIGCVDEDLIFKAVEKAEKVICRSINYHLADRREFLSKLKNQYFYKDILKGYILIIGGKDEFRKFIKSVN